MPAGWEGVVRLSRAPGWTDPGTTTGTLGVFLLAESVALDYGAQEISRDNKITGQRVSPYVNYYIAGNKIYPNGDITYEADALSLAMIFTSAFQYATSLGVTGTFVAVSVLNRSLNWGSGFALGTFPYCLNADVVYQGNVTGANGIRYMQGIVDRISISVRNGEDIKVTPSFKFKTASYFTYVAGYGPTANGTLMPDTYTDAGVQATLTIGGVNMISQLNISEIAINFENNTADVAQIGGTNYAKYPFLGRLKANVSITAELPAYNLASFLPGNAATFSVRFVPISSNAWWQINSIGDIIKPYNIPISSGDSLVEVTIPIELMNPSATFNLLGSCVGFII